VDYRLCGNLDLSAVQLAVYRGRMMIFSDTDNMYRLATHLLDERRREADLQRLASAATARPQATRHARRALAAALRSLAYVLDPRAITSAQSIRRAA
jgi:hypothetical protein